MKRTRSPFVLCLLISLSLTRCAGESSDDDAFGVEPALENAAGKSDELLKAQGMEVKVTVRGDELEYAEEVFRLDRENAQRRWVYFYDTPDLDLFGAGVILRSRKIRDEADDSTVKIRPLEREAVDSSWFSREGFKCEIDRSGQRSQSSCSFTAGAEKGAIDAVARHQREIVSLFGKRQQGFLDQHAELSPSWGSLAVLGPIHAWVWSIKDKKKYPNKVTAERWELADGSALLELSTRVAADDEVGAESFLAYLRGKGLDTSAEGETKTRSALQSFTRQE